MLLVFMDIIENKSYVLLIYVVMDSDFFFTLLYQSVSNVVHDKWTYLMI